jgi:hypothetical protein
LSYVRGCLFNIFAATLYSWRPFLHPQHQDAPCHGERDPTLANIRMDLLELGRGDVDWIGLAQDRNRCRALVNSVLNLWVPKNDEKLSSALTSLGSSSGAQLHRVS